MSTSQPQSYFQPVPPIRTSTVDSVKTQSSGVASPGSEAFSPSSTATQSIASPTENRFFEAISSTLRHARSRSRSRASKSRSRSRSPMMLPPEQIPGGPNSHARSPTQSTQRPQQPRHISQNSQSSITKTSARRTSADMWHGRQTNNWLFNNVSVTETAKEIFHRGRKS
jgi:hypothetical protein